MGQKLNLPYPLVGHIIVYIVRDSFSKFKAFITEGINFQKIKTTVKYYREAKEIFKKGSFINVIKKCKTEVDAKYCPYKSLCFKGDINKTLSYYWNLKNKI